MKRKNCTRLESSSLRRITLIHLIATLSVMFSACERVPSLSPQPPEAQTARITALPTPDPSEKPGETFRFPLAKSLAFDHLTPAEGLSQSVVTDVLQDNLGFIWLATQDGLNRYDGNEFKIFKHDPRDPNVLSNSFASSIEKDLSGNLWIGTNARGLNRYDPKTGLFSYYLHDPEDPHSLSENSISALHLDRGGILWIGTPNSGLNSFAMQEGRFIRFQYDPSDPNSLSHNSVSSIWQTKDGDLWVGTTGGGLNRLDRGSGKFKRYSADSAMVGSLSSNFISSVYEDKQGTIWVGTTDAGLYRFVPETGAFIQYSNRPGDASSLSDNWVTAIFEDRKGKLWIGTYRGGLNILDRQTGSFSQYANDPYDPLSLANDSITSIFEDRSGLLWIGTFGSGADLYDPLKDRFLHFSSRPGAPQGLSSNQIWAIYEDLQQNLWIGTLGGGLNRVDLQTGVWIHYLSDPAIPTSLNSNNIFSIYQDREGTLWIGTDVGINRFDPKTGEFEALNLSALVISILEDHLGNFWIGSAIGLFLLDRHTGEYQLFVNHSDDPTSLSSNNVSVIREDRQGDLWIGTLNAGLNRFDRQKQNFHRYQSHLGDPTNLSDNGIISIFPAADGTIWIGTAGGLNRLNPETGEIIFFREADGLPNDYVYGILEDKQGCLWLSTNRGISRFDPVTLEFKNFDTSDGLRGLEFNQGAAFENQAGVMYFGGVQGLDVFHPDYIYDNPYVPPIVITDFQIYYQPVEVGPDSLVKQPVEVSQEILLPYTDNTFEFGFAALDFMSPEEQQFAYILEGFDEAWNHVGNRRVAPYTRVKPGNYVFRVKGANSDGIWNETGAAIKLTIPPPFWQTTWFRLLGLTITVGAFLAGFVLRIRSVEKQRQRLELQVAERTRELHVTMLELERSKDAAEAANQAKSTFLANMSHEFRTPLNAILGFTQVLVWDKSLSPDHKKNLEIIHRSSEHLLGLINDVLEISKIEAGRLALNPHNFDLYHMLEGLEEMFRLRAEDKGLALDLKLSPQVPHYIRADEGKLRQVLMNLLGNAVKFTQQGSVTVDVSAPPRNEAASERGQSIRFEIADTGPGIAVNEMGKLFTPFIQTSSGAQSAEGTGLGLPISQQYVRLMGGEIEVLSAVGKGSVFQFELPIEVVTSYDLEKPRPTRRVVGLKSGQPTYRILVVDDQAVNRKLLVRIFSPVGFEVREASNGEEAVEIWEAWSPHLIWMDMRMPVMNGYEATRRIKSTTGGQATIVIALTASGLEEDRSIILSEGCDDYIRKPFHEEDLFEAMARHLGVRYVYEELEPSDASEAILVLPPSERAAAQRLAFQDLSARLSHVDPVWLDSLERATVLGEHEVILELLNQIVEEEPHLAAMIAELAEKFDHDRILKLIHQAAKGRQHAAD